MPTFYRHRTFMLLAVAGNRFEYWHPALLWLLATCRLLGLRGLGMERGEQ